MCAASPIGWGGGVSATCAIFPAVLTVSRIRFVFGLRPGGWGRERRQASR